MRSLSLILVLVVIGACGPESGGLAVALRWPAPATAAAPAGVATMRLDLEGPEWYEVEVPVAEGGYAWEALTPGHYRLRVEALGGTGIPWYAGAASAVVRAGATTRLTVPLERADGIGG